MGIKKAFRIVAQRKHKVVLRGFHTKHYPFSLKACPPMADGVVVFLIVLLFFSFQSFGQVELIPKPYSVEYQKGVYQYFTQIDVVLTDSEFSAAATLFSSYHSEFNSGLRFRSNRGSREESITIQQVDTKEYSYVLTVNENGVLLEASDLNGAIQGVQTVRQLLTLSRGDSDEFIIEIPYVVIKDYPRFEHRGLLLDCSRHFFSVATVKKYIDLLAFYKMNTLHWHLTEDQGWRIEIDKYPKLTEVGAWRTEKDGSRYGGFYTKEEIKEVIEFATSRGVTVIPEIELPGHSQAAVASYSNVSSSMTPISPVPEPF